MSEDKTSEATPTDETPVPILPHTRDATAADALPPPISTNCGPMDQTVPDVATGSTPLTRADD